MKLPLDTNTRIDLNGCHSYTMAKSLKRILEDETGPPEVHGKLTFIVGIPWTPFYFDPIWHAADDEWPELERDGPGGYELPPPPPPEEDEESQAPPADEEEEEESSSL